jgi:hypothetical protein
VETWTDPETGAVVTARSREAFEKVLRALRTAGSGGWHVHLYPREDDAPEGTTEPQEGTCPVCGSAIVDGLCDNYDEFDHE